MAGTVRTEFGIQIQLGAGSVVAERYVLTGLLGSGSYGEVWSAADAARKWRHVAVKLLRLGGEVAQGRFESEMRALMLLRPHLHVVELLDHGVHQGQRYMVMEYLSGGSLAHWLSARKAARLLPELPQVWRWFDQICQAMAAAHTLIEPGPIIHRDINPNNGLAARKWRPAPCRGAAVARRRFRAAAKYSFSGAFGAERYLRALWDRSSAGFYWHWLSRTTAAPAL